MKRFAGECAVHNVARWTLSHFLRVPGTQLEIRNRRPTQRARYAAARRRSQFRDAMEPSVGRVAGYCDSSPESHVSAGCGFLSILSGARRLRRGWGREVRHRRSVKQISQSSTYTGRTNRFIVNSRYHFNEPGNSVIPYQIYCAPSESAAGHSRAPHSINVR